MARIFVGTSGWAYKSWREPLYHGAPARQWLSIASRVFPSLEINGSFYRQISPATYGRWRDETPAGFRFALKGHRFVTHFKRLKGVEQSVIRLRDQATALGDKLAAIVWQLPQRLAVDLARLDSFLTTLTVWPARHAIEFRNATWFIPAVADRLRAAGVAVCMGDAPDFPLWDEVTARFVYVRLHGHTHKYASSYSTASLQKWALSAHRWIAEGRDVHIYFDNDAKAAAVRNARAFMAISDAMASTGGRAPRTRRVAAR